MCVNASLTSHPPLHTASQRRNIFAIFLLTFIALHMSAGLISVFIYRSASFHIELVTQEVVNVRDAAKRHLVRKNLDLI